MNKKEGERLSDGLCGLGFILIPVFLSEEKRYSGSLSLQWREGVQVPLPSEERRWSGFLSFQRAEAGKFSFPSEGRGGQVLFPFRGQRGASPLSL